jgi:adenine-specific DNA-methyltransferase
MNNPDKLKIQTPDLTAENIARLAALFPGVVADGKVNVDLLRSYVGEEIFGDEAYEFTWVGKRAAIAEAGRSIRKTLRPCPQESRDWDTTENLYIEGDNLDVLKLLQESYLGKVKMVYIDPPYNTGSDFVYRDNFTANREDYEEEVGVYDEDGDRLFKNTETNGRFHSDWCSMIYPRLVLARNLLRDDGVIFISIDDGEVAQLRKICDEVFGASNFAACIPWQSRLSMQNDTDLSINHEYLLVYAKHRRFENRRLKESNAGSWYAKDSFVFRPLPLDKSKFENPDNDPRGPWKADPFDAPNVRPNLTYPVTNPFTGDRHLPPSGRHWRVSPEKFSSALADGRIIFGRNGTGRPQMKSFYEEKKDFGSIGSAWFSGDKVGTATAATKELQALFDNAPFDTPKPTTLLKKLLTIAFVESGDIVLDFFSGSATTAHAVMQLNAEDGGKRKFIMVQLPEVCAEGSEAAKAGYANICEIGKERIRRAGDKIKDEAGLTAQELDTGFRVLKLADTNMNDVYYAAGDYTQDMLLLIQDNIKSDRSGLDLLFGCLLDWGLPLSMPHAHEVTNGVTVHTYNGGDLIACFNKAVSETLVREIAKRQPLRAVFRDSSFAGSPEKINVTEIFKLLAPNTTVKVI